MHVGKYLITFRDSNKMCVKTYKRWFFNFAWKYDIPYLHFDFLPNLPYLIFGISNLLTTFLIVVATENSVCVLGDCAPDKGAVGLGNETLTPHSECGATCRAAYPSCIATVITTRNLISLCYKFSKCPAIPPIYHVTVSNKRIYVCYISKSDIL